MLNRIEVVEPPNSAPQYMHDSRMIADTGCIVNVSGSSSVTPLGAPSPGSTPTRMPSSTPTTISITWYGVRATANPCSSASKDSIAWSWVERSGAERLDQPIDQRTLVQLDLEPGFEQH